MTARTLSEAIFELGRISTARHITNCSLLKKLTELTFESIGADVVALAVFERGIDSPPTASYSHGPWTREHRDPFLEQSGWKLDEGLLAQRLSGLRRGKLYHRPDLIAELDIGASRQREELPSSLDGGDQALALYRRSDGAELLLALNKVPGTGQFPRAQLARAGAMAPFVAQCWAATWRREPVWMGQLKPQCRSILEHLLQGYDDDQIAQRTGLSYHSVRAHLKRLFREANVRSRLHLMQACKSEGEQPVLMVELPVDDHLNRAIG